MISTINELSIYLHIPFCQKRCNYCDFITYAGQKDLIPAYVTALCCELEHVGRIAPGGYMVRTIYFGGGTPSLLSVQEFGLIFRTLHKRFPFLEDVEISVEANPGTVSLKKLKALRTLGVNRISFGVQSFDPQELQQLGRIHTPYDAMNAMYWARLAGFTNVNLDLIFGLPGQDLYRWQRNVERAVSLSPEHISLYALTIEGNTPFGEWHHRGLIQDPDPDIAADMYTWAARYLDERGYKQYEISNWSKPDRQCRHNLQYWHNFQYLGFGAGAHGYASGMRIANHKQIRNYISLCKEKNENAVFPISPATVQIEKISIDEEMRETMITGLRLTRDGVSQKSFRRRFGCELMDRFGAEIERTIERGLLEWCGEYKDILRLTERGYLLGNIVFQEFVR